MSETSTTDSHDDSTDEAAALAGAVAVVDHLSRSLVDEPDAVGVTLDIDQATPRINVTAAEGEIGRLIGKRGRTAMAIRAIGRAVANKDDAGSVDVEFLD